MNLGVVPSYGFKSLDDCQKFHPVVGSHAETLRHLHLMASAFQNYSIPSGSGITARSSIRVKIDRWPALSFILRHDYSMILPPLGFISVSGIFMVILFSTRSS